MTDDKLGPNLGRRKTADDLSWYDDDSIHVLAPGETETTLCGQSLDAVINACSMDTGYKPDTMAGCWTCLQAANRWATAS